MKLFAVLSVLLMTSFPAAAGSLYHWRTDDGAYAFSDDLRRVPPRYREQAKQSAMASLSDYKGYTPGDAAASERYGKALNERLGHLREFNAKAATQAAKRKEIADSAEQEPLMIEEFRVLEDETLWRQRTVRRGDKVVAIEKREVGRVGVTERRGVIESLFDDVIDSVLD